MATFSTVPNQYAPKRKFLEFAKPKWHSKLGEFNDPDVMSWINNLYQDKAFPTREAFNKAYDAARAEGRMPSAGVAWANRTMVLQKEDLENLEEEFNEGAFDGPAQPKVCALIAKLKRAQESAKTVFVY